MVREIIIYPDRRLKVISKKVTLFGEKLHNLLDDMYDTMVSREGIGLAAIQIGINKRVIIINIAKEDENKNVIFKKENTLEIINPTIVKMDGSCKYQEGCLSVPGIYEDIERAKEIVVEYYNRYGEKKRLTADDLLSVAIQHEIDHLNGKIFVEKLSYTKRKKFEKGWKKRGKR